ncbi:imidazole glycerol phosphate synthase subunit HisH [Coralliovum pocilloporae]|uniref:imidazole glycerol phosphate synthase subunit HisH n=1 Tax=Coralliovum pocilloporae TaxID=3066369 RepID=UPI003307508D
MKLVIIDYGSGNLRSAEKAFRRAARDSGLDVEVSVSASADEVAAADRIVLPGVGAFADCCHGLEAVSGMRDALEEAVISKGRPFFGICVGMQLMASRGLEHVTTEGFNWIPGDVGPIEPADPGLKVPHMGWNIIDVRNDHPVFAGIPTGPDGLHAYFVHSYHFRTASPDHVLAETDYAGSVTAAVGRDNMIGTQFHPEKSQTLGLSLIANFMRWAP